MKHRYLLGLIDTISVFFVFFGSIHLLSFFFKGHKFQPEIGAPIAALLVILGLFLHFTTRFWRQRM